MDAGKVNSWLSLGANFGVLAGIALLVLEINQATLTTRAEMVSNHQDRWVSMDLSWQDADFADTWATALQAPEELTHAQMIQLNGFMWAFFDHIATTRVLWNLGILDRPLETADAIIEGNAYIFLGTVMFESLGPLAWVEENRHNLSEQGLRTIDAVRDSSSGGDTLAMYECIRQRIKQQQPGPGCRTKERSGE